MTNVRIRILLVEDQPGDARFIRELLSESRAATYDIEHVKTLAAARQALARPDFDVVLLDLSLPDSEGLDTVTRLQEVNGHLPIIVLTGFDDDDLALRMAQVRVEQYLVKGRVDQQTLSRSIGYALERQRAKSQLDHEIETISASEENLRHVLTTSADGILIVDWDGIVLFSNPVADAMIGVQPGELTGRVFEHPLAAGTSAEVSLRADLIAEMRVTATTWEGKPVFLASLRDVTERKKGEDHLRDLTEKLQAANTQLEKLANVDPLTDLLNRRGLERILWGEINRSQRSRAPIMALLLDCDDFKSVNDSLGHAVGDIVLKEMAKRLERSVRPSDQLARIGGDEFLVLLPDTRFAEALQIAERIRLAIADEPLMTGGRMIKITASIGVAHVPTSVSSIGEILLHAHTALKESKDTGKNRVSGTAITTSEEEFIRHDLQEELRRGKCFRTVRQKIMRLEDEALVGYELLSRGPPGPYEMPADFFRLSEDHDLRTLVDLNCLRTCLASAREATTPLHVNLFPTTMLSTSPDRLVDIFVEARASQSMCLEMSEQHFVGDPNTLKDHVDALRDVGIRIAIDDMGFGRSSLEAWILLQPHIVKVDHRLLKEFSTDTAKDGPVKRFMRVAATLGTDVVAEGIERREDLGVLKDLGVRFGQGYLWGAPA
jgi:diguanylate cyclase (GGDEF)-like protein